MAYGISNKCAKNFCKRAVLVHVIVEDVVTRFLLGHGVSQNMGAIMALPGGPHISCHTLGPRLFLQKK